MSVNCFWVELLLKASRQREGAVQRLIVTGSEGGVRIPVADAAPAVAGDFFDYSHPGRC